MEVCKCFEKWSCVGEWKDYWPTGTAHHHSHHRVTEEAYTPLFNSYCRSCKKKKRRIVYVFFYLTWTDFFFFLLLLLHFFFLSCSRQGRGILHTRVSYADKPRPHSLYCSLALPPPFLPKYIIRTSSCVLPSSPSPSSSCFTFPFPHFFLKFLSFSLLCFYFFFSFMFFFILLFLFFVSSYYAILVLYFDF